MVRVITIGREFGSGGAAVAQRAADRLGWKLLDNALVEQIAHSAKVDPSMARRFDESTDSWLHRATKQALWHGAIESVATVAPGQFFDSEEMAHTARAVIEGAAAEGNCVIVGRGAQCILHGRPGVFHLFVYAPWQQKLKRVKERLPELKDPAALIRETDRRRIDYIRRYFQQDWCNPHLYDMMINTRCGEEFAVDAVLRGAQLPK